MLIIAANTLFLLYLPARVNGQMLGTVHAVVKRLTECTASSCGSVKREPVPRSSQREAQPGNGKVTCPCYPSARSTSHLLEQTAGLLQSRFLDCATLVFKPCWTRTPVKLTCLVLHMHTLQSRWPLYPDSTKMDSHKNIQTKGHSDTVALTCPFAHFLLLCSSQPSVPRFYYFRNKMSQMIG